MEGPLSVSQYLIQSVLHSLVTLVVIEIALNVWQVRSPEGRFRYRLQTLLLPVGMYPVFQVLDPSRGSTYFITDRAIFNSGGWLSIDLWGILPVWVVVGSILGATAAVTLAQEIVPVVRHTVSSRLTSLSFRDSPSELHRTITDLSDRMGIPTPPVRLADHDEPLLFVNGTRQPDVVITRGALNRFGDRELRAALAHELAHIVRRSTSVTLLAFLARILMFHNPVSLFVFRRLVQDDEQVCDDLTVSVTGDPDGLASALASFHLEFTPRTTLEFVSRQSHNLLLEDRISRLRNPERETSEPTVPALLLTVFSVITLCYFVV